MAQSGFFKMIFERSKMRQSYLSQYAVKKEALPCTLEKTTTET